MRVLLRLCVIAACVYVCVLAGLYIFQERLIFLGEPLDKNFKFSFENSEFTGLVNAPESGARLDMQASATQGAATNGAADEGASAASGTKESGAVAGNSAGEIKAGAETSGFENENTQTSFERVGENTAQDVTAGNNANAAAIKFQEINIPFGGGFINGLKFSAAEPKGAILFFHGNFGDVSGWGAYGADFAALGYDFYIFDYPGYGKSDGKISSQQQLFASADAMSRYVLAQHPPRKLAMIGYSIGSGIAAQQAAKWDAARLILLAPYFSFERLAHEKIPFVPKFLIRYKIPTAEFLRAARGTQITLIHGAADELIPVQHSNDLAGSLKAGDLFYEIPDARHNGLLAMPGTWKILKERLR
ncbi:alpha/beta fold hydrolase [uncultured Campylobacter sp.]|uniref:alpha/beta hydrolase n=1 Tax=uncultured Campylobacter sp. TaxID=218934 RepID=UPI002632F4BE|nr:alpha/beta fold hydrolase [uncultured Campylobacter sp.]